MFLFELQRKLFSVAIEKSGIDFGIYHNKSRFILFDKIINEANKIKNATIVIQAIRIIVLTRLFMKKSTNKGTWHLI